MVRKPKTSVVLDKKTLMLGLKVIANVYLRNGRDENKTILALKAANVYDERTFPSMLDAAKELIKLGVN